MQVKHVIFVRGVSHCDLIHDIVIMVYKLRILAHQEDMVDVVIFHLLLASVEHAELFLKQHPLWLDLLARDERSDQCLCLDDLHNLCSVSVATLFNFS
jgi:hypothetical protein